MKVIGKWALCLTCWAVLTIAGTASAPANPGPGFFEKAYSIVDQDLLDTLHSRGTSEMLVYLRETADLSPAFEMDWETRGRFVYEQLTAVADRTQANLVSHLSTRGVDFQTFWVDNVIVVRQGDITLLNELVTFGEIGRIKGDSESRLFTSEQTGPAGLHGGGERAPIGSIAQIKAPDVWDMGFTGEGIVVGIIDSGTRHTHAALVNQYRGNQGGGVFDHNYNWFDLDGSTVPQFPHPHGTHVTGTAIGDDGGANQIGVAPGAEWISCLGCTGTGCPQSNLLACAEFMTAPTDLAGNNPDPDRRPHVVNNSWGNCQQFYNDWYQGAVDAWVAAGIVPVFSNGNASNCGYSSPPGLNTVGNPARYGNVLGVGSSGNTTGLYANHSNWGPTDNLSPGLPNVPDHFGHPELKPNIIAPGVEIYSSLSSGDTSYGSTNWTGTSMSAPQVSGLVALMWNAAPCLIGDYPTTGTIIMETANPLPYASGGPNVGPGDVPNHATGWGEIDALAAVTEAITRCGPQGTLEGEVTIAASGAPLPGVTVTVDNPLPPPATLIASTDASGFYSRALPMLEQPDGTYSVTFSKPGYESVVVTDIEIPEDATVTLNAALEAGHLVMPATVSVVAIHGTLATVDYPVSNTGGVDAETSLSLLGIMREDFEGDFPPDGWEVLNNGGDCVWTRNDEITPAVGPVDPNHGGRPNFAGGQGFSATLDSDACGQGSSSNSSLITPAFSLAGAGAGIAEFVAAYRHLGSSSFSVAVSGDGGDTWDNQLTWTTDQSSEGPGLPVSIDLEDYLGATEVHLRFRYQGDWHWWIQVDQFQLTSLPDWASVIPGGPATVEAGESSNYQLQFDTSQLPGPGVYHLQMIVDHDTPESIGPIPVTVHVVEADEAFRDRFEVTAF